MRFIVGGESLDLTREQVVAAMEGATSEPVRKHVVEIDGQALPPKQVFATVTGRLRQSFTTMEAQRILTRLGFVCHRVGPLAEGNAAARESSPEERFADLEVAVGTLHVAIAGLHARVGLLESTR